MRRPHPIIDGRACILAVILACTPRPVPEASSTATTGTVTAETTTSTTTAIPTSTSETTSTTAALTATTGTPLPEATTTIGFIITPDGGSPEPHQECDGLQQLDPECPDGQKCTLDGGVSSTHCVDIVDDPKAMYEPCTMQGDYLSGLDDCDLGLICWDVDERGHGICIGLCDGDGQMCTCVDPKASGGFFCQECAVGFCFPGCDPLIQDCNGTDLCIPNDKSFLCVLDASGDEGQFNDPCEFANSCDKGLVCSPPSTASSACDQDATGCCQPFCSTEDNAPCPNPDQSCVAFFPPGEAPPGHEDVGICSIPP